jgi:hypothetical protein
MKRLAITITILTLLITVNGVAQENSFINSTTPNNFGNMFSKFSLLDPSKIDMQQSISVSYQTDGKNSLMSNMYTNTIRYQISKPLSMKIHLGFEHQPAGFSNVLESDQSHFLPGFELTYKPSKNFMFHFEYNTYTPFSSSKGPWMNNMYPFSREW